MASNLENPPLDVVTEEDEEEVDDGLEQDNRTWPLRRRGSSEEEPIRCICSHKWKVLENLDEPGTSGEIDKVQAALVEMQAAYDKLTEQSAEAKQTLDSIPLWTILNEADANAVDQFWKLKDLVNGMDGEWTMLIASLHRIRTLADKINARLVAKATRGGIAVAPKIVFEMFMGQGLVISPME